MSPGQPVPDPAWPPGTVLIEGATDTIKDKLAKANTTKDLSQPGNSEVVLQPRPTRSPNDPLVRAHNED